jgi:bifunctional non-homologous end joining protein LigD
MLAVIDSKGVRFYSHNRLEWTDRFRTLAGAVGKLDARDGILDGEIVVFDDEGRSDFGLMQQALSEGGGTFYHIAFDLLRVNGKDYRAYTLLERKARLRQLIHGDHGLVRYSDHLEGDGTVVHRHACRMGLEGIISKRADAPYRSGGRRDWVKIKCLGRDEYWIGGYIGSTVRGRPFASLLVGEKKEEKLIFRGHVGTGYSEATLIIVGDKLKEIRREKMPFEYVPREYLKGARWVEPKLLAEVKYSNVTRAGILRHASFVELREDKAAPDAFLVIHQR